MCCAQPCLLGRSGICTQDDDLADGSGQKWSVIGYIIEYISAEKRIKRFVPVKS